MDRVNKAKRYERDFEYGKGIIPTSKKCLSYFWKTHYNKVFESLKPFIHEARTILFIGVGEGDVISALPIENKTVIGIDLNTKFLSHAHGCCRALAADGTIIPLKNCSIDLVICNMVLHHIVGQEGLEKALHESRRVLKDGGRLVAFEPNLFHPSGMAMTLLNRFHLYHALMGGSDYEYALSPFRIARICRSLFKKTEIKAITFSHPRFPVFIQKMCFSLDQYLSGMYPFSFSFALEAIK